VCLQCTKSAVKAELFQEEKSGRVDAATERQHGDGYSNWIATAALYSVALSAFVASIYLLTLLGAF